MSILGLAAFLLAMVPQATAQSLTDCPNTVRIVDGCDDYVAPERGPAFVAGEQSLGGMTVLYAPSEGDDAAYRAAISAALGGATVDYFDAGAATPSVAFLSGYDAVITWTNFSYADRDAFGDNLATFADAGGTVLLGVFTTYDGGNSLGGAIRGAGYSPVANPTGTNAFLSDDWAGDGSLFYSGVTALECTFRDIVDLQGAGAEDGTYLGDGETLGAYRPDFGVMFANGSGHSSLGCTGDWAQLEANMLMAAGGGGVTIDYLGSTEDPQRNDYVFIRARATNSSASTIRTRIYFTVDYPNGATRTYSVLSSDFPGGTSFQVQQIKRMRFPIPAAAPAGTYTVTIYAADDIANGGTVYDSDTFTFDLAAPKTGDLASGVDAGPNPFTSETTIRYELAEAAEVDLRVFDVTGREVAQLATGTHSAGAHSALFAAGDLPGGVYVWRLAVGGEVTTGRVTLAR